MAPTGKYQGQQQGPMVENLETSSTVSQRLIILEGRAGGSHPPPFSHLLAHPDSSSGFSPVKWEVNHGFFKALVSLTPGNNDIKLDWLQTESSSPISTHFNLNFQPSNAPPLHLAILVASDSPSLRNNGRVDLSQQQPSKQQSHGSMFKRVLTPLKSNFGSSDSGDRPIVDCPNNWRKQVLSEGGLDEVKRRFAIQAYLWQAFHSEQMRRHQLGSRTFSLDDTASDPTPKSNSSLREIEHLPKIHILKSRHTLKEFRDPNNAQQFKGARNGGAMHQFAMEALSNPSVPRELHQSPVAVLVLDTTYDPNMKLLRAHAAVGSGGAGQTSIGCMGSGWLWAAPSRLEYVTPAFLDEERTDEACVVNDLNECPTAWETLNIGSGAFMHEVGHALDNPHWPSGLMSRGYVEFNRAFMTRSPSCARSGCPSISPINSSNDSGQNHIHRAQAIRARWHPTCRLPSDPYLPFLRSGDASARREWNDTSPSWSAGANGPTARCSSGIGAIEVEVDGRYMTSIEFTGLENGTPPSSSLQISPSYLASTLGFDPLLGDRKVMLRALACNMRQSELKDYKAFGFLKEIQMKEFSSPVVKTMFSGQEGDRKWIVPIQDLKAIEIFSGGAFDGLRFHSNSSSPPAAFGPLGGGSPFVFKVCPGDTITKLLLRAGAWIDAIDIHFSSGATSGMHGNLSGGSLATLEAPEGYSIRGIYGTSSQWVTSIGLICSRDAGQSVPQPFPVSRGVGQDLTSGEVIFPLFGDRPILLCEVAGGEAKDALLTPIPQDVREIEIYAGAAFDGLKLHSSQSSSAAFGPLGGSSKARLLLEPNDRISKVEVRAGAWIDGINIHLQSGKSTGMQGNSEGGSLKVLEAPEGYKIVGFRGSSERWIHGIGLVCRRV